MQFFLLTSFLFSVTPFHFKLFSGSSFVDLSRCYLVSEFKILKKDADGNMVNLDAGDNVSTIQMLGSSFIRNLKADRFFSGCNSV